MLAQGQPSSQRPPSPKSAVGGPTHRPLKRPTLPSKLSNVNLASQNSNLSNPLRSDEEQARVGAVKDNDVDSSVIDLEDPFPSTASRIEEGNAAASSTSSPSSAQVRATSAARRSVPLPLPKRLSSLSSDVGYNPLDDKFSNRTARSKRDPARRANGVKAPSIATKLSDTKVADFFPWTGSQSEDILNDSVIRSGYADKPLGSNNQNSQSNQSESHTARPSLWPSLKNKSGLPLLSALFVQVYERRQALGRCTAPSTFKPPPRVTLTDTKREAWLRDLANPSVPLRRLSRTIPHGIRGKTLLDQCIGKDIPIPRAIWLAKCVGANEIRAFRRKGVSGSAAYGGELKWIREWTVFVEQFVDGIIVSCGCDQWQGKMNYAIRLMTHFFSETLLDNDHLFDWLLSSFETSSLERLPVWIIMIQIYWKSLVSQQKLGHRLANALLARLDDLTGNRPASANDLLITRLQRLVVALATAHKGCLIGIKTWNKHNRVLEDILVAQQFAQHQSLLSTVISRNSRLSGTNSSGVSAARSPSLQVLDKLDSVRLDINIDLLASDCQRLVPVFVDLVMIVLQWSSSKYREGCSRVYLAAALLRFWKGTNLDIESDILSALSRINVGSGLDRDPLHKVIAELVQTQHFSLGKYLQWLISMGASASMNTAADAHLLVNVPTTCLAPGVRNLRRTLLNRLGYSSDEEHSSIGYTKTTLSQVLFRIETQNAQHHDYSVLTANLSKLSGKAKYAVSEWLSARYEHDKTSQTQDSMHGSTLSLATFASVRAVLECLGDLKSLAHMVSIATESYDPSLLATVADTVNMHCKPFAVLGMLAGLSEKLCKQQRVLRGQQPLDRVFLSSMSNLAQHVPMEPGFVKALARDFSVCEQQGSAAACSPASDSMVATPLGSLNADEDIDRVLSSGNSMEEQLMTRMFATIADRAMQVKSDQLGGIEKAGRWFSQLRLFDPMTFDRLANSTVVKVMDAASRQQLWALFSALIGSSCAKLDMVLQAFERRLEVVGPIDPSAAASLASIALQTLIPDAMERQSPTLPEAYRLRLAQQQLCEEKMSNILQLLRYSLSDRGNTSVVLAEQHVLRLLRQYVVENYALVASTLVREHCAAFQGQNSASSSLFDALINPEADRNQASDAGVTPNMEGLIASATELSMPFCLLALESSTLSSRSQHGTNDERPDMLRPLQAAIERDAPLWPQYLGSMNQDVKAQLNRWASDAVLDAASSLSVDTGLSRRRKDIQKYLKVAEMTTSAADVVPSRRLPVISERLKILGEQLSSIKPLHNMFLASEEPSSTDVCFWIESLLKLAALQRNTTTSSGDQARLLLCLLSLIVLPSLQLHRPTLEYMTDVALLCASDVSTEQLSAISRHMPQVVRSDPRIKFILGTETSPESWLVLASRAPGTNPASVTSQPSSGQMSQPMGRPPQPQLSHQRSISQSLPSPSVSQSPQMPQQQRQQPGRAGAGAFPEMKITPFALRRWEIMPDPTPNMGENDTSLSLSLFAARRV